MDLCSPALRPPSPNKTSTSARGLSPATSWPTAPGPRAPCCKRSLPNVPPMELAILALASGDTPSTPLYSGEDKNNRASNCAFARASPPSGSSNMLGFPRGAKLTSPPWAAPAILNSATALLNDLYSTSLNSLAARNSKGVRCRKSLFPPARVVWETE